MTLTAFMDAHRFIGNVPTEPYKNRISVAASAYDGKGRVAVKGETPQGQHIGGLMSVDRARMLVSQLEEAIEYAEATAREQQAASVPDLERRLAEVRGAAFGKERQP